MGRSAAMRVSSGKVISGVRFFMAKYNFSRVFNRINGHSLQLQALWGGAGIRCLPGAGF